jgi:multisubunit Na+/H+ antiporter MnhB subunit
MDNHFKNPIKFIKRKKAVTMTGIKKLLFLLSAILLSVIAFSQDSPDRTVGMADTMRSNGRIYVVVAVIVTIFIGLFLYLVRLDKKISKWEKLEKKK